MNKLFLTGRVGKTPDIKQFPNGKQASFTFATTEKWRTKEGEKKERTEWHNLVVNGKLADVVEMYVVKGSQLAIEGGIRYRDWEDTEGKKHYITEIHVAHMEMLGSPAQSKPATDSASIEKGIDPDLTTEGGEDDLPSN